MEITHCVERFLDGSALGLRWREQERITALLRQSIEPHAAKHIITTVIQPPEAILWVDSSAGATLLRFRTLALREKLLELTAGSTVALRIRIAYARRSTNAAALADPPPATAHRASNLSSDEALQRALKKLTEALRLHQPSDEQDPSR